MACDAADEGAVHALAHNRLGLALAAYLYFAVVNAIRRASLTAVAAAEGLALRTVAYFAAAALAAEGDEGIGDD